MAQSKNSGSAGRAKPRKKGEDWITLRGPDREDAVLWRDPDTGEEVRGRAPGEVIGYIKPGREAAEAEAQERRSTGDRGTSVLAFDRVRARVLAAKDTLRAMPSPPELAALESTRSQLSGVVPQEPTIRPTAKQIDQADEVLGWLALLDDDHRLIVAAVLAGTSYRRLGKLLGCSQVSIKRRFDAAVRQIVIALAAPKLDLGARTK